MTGVRYVIDDSRNNGKEWFLAVAFIMFINFDKFPVCCTDFWTGVVV